jgi:formate dehydrogenase major subunit
MPVAGQHDTLQDYVATISKKGMKGFWTGADAYTVSLLKSWYGDAAQPENDFCFDLIPKLTGDHGTYQTVMDQIDGKVEGYFLVGQNPAVGSAQAKMQRLGLANLKWLVVRDVNLIESATFWKDAPEIATGELRTEDIATEVFFLPAATHTEKAGTFTQTQRMVQWRHKAVNPPGDARRSWTSTTSWGCGCASGWPARPTPRTGRCSTSPGTTRSTSTASRRRSRCWPRSTAPSSR